MFLFKLLITNAIIVSCVLIGRRLPSLAGLIAAMPLTSLLVLVWLYSDNPGDLRSLARYCGGVLWGIIPTVLFFAVALVCLRRQISLPLTLSLGFAVWLAGAVIHQWFLR